MFGPVTVSATLSTQQLALIVNDADPLSVEIGRYYAEQRAIPAANVIHVELPHDKPAIGASAFNRVFDEVRALTPENVQAYALTWVSPYRVDCMSITTAFAMGYASRHCAKGCRATAPNPYFNSSSTEPFTDFGFRPTMAIAARTVENAKSLIDRGVQSDFTKPPANTYLVITQDRSRNTRRPTFELVKHRLSPIIPVSLVHGEGVRDRSDIMFYFIGAKNVPYLDSIEFSPGAMADHLTSSGGRLTRSKQMSALRWLEAGATGSYGTVVEPCNFPQKFPNPLVAMEHYLAGDTLIEAYWKSVVWPGQGIFIGDPLAKPYADQASSGSVADMADSGNE
jgi:uncharacterized protein (TIGR03790 family)